MLEIARLEWMRRQVVKIQWFVDLIQTFSLHINYNMTVMFGCIEDDNELWVIWLHDCSLTSACTIFVWLMNQICDCFFDIKTVWMIPCKFVENFFQIGSTVLIKLCLFCVCTVMIDDIEDLILFFMLEFIVRMIAEYAWPRCPRQLRMCTIFTSKCLLDEC